MRKILNELRRYQARFSDELFIASSIKHARLVRRRTHTLPGKLVVSITSFPPRFPTLARTLKSVLQQQTIPDRIVLWIANNDLDKLPLNVTELTTSGLTISTCEDLLSYKKLLPALEQDPDAFHVTADDDVFYSSDWLGNLVNAHDPADPAVLATRVHRIRSHSDGSPVRYMDWDHDALDASARQTSSDLVPTGVGGIMYPPGSLHARVGDIASVMRLAPKTDDLWFYWMARLAGWGHRKVGGRFRLIQWDGTEDFSLFKENIERNDLTVANLLSEFGDPRTRTVRRF
jgi:hypothetical protein